MRVCVCALRRRLQTVCAGARLPPVREEVTLPAASHAADVVSVTGKLWGHRVFPEVREEHLVVVSVHLAHVFFPRRRSSSSKYGIYRSGPVQQPKIPRPGQHRTFPARGGAHRPPSARRE